MTTHAMKRNTSWKKRNIIRIATWNIKSWNNRDQELIEELKQKKIDICAIQETKKKGKGQKDYGEYILIYSGVEKEVRAKAGVGILLNKKLKNFIQECNYVSERILLVKLKTDGPDLNIMSVYSPENCKPRIDKETFYENLQTTLEPIRTQDYICVLGDFNARIGNDIIDNVKQRFNEEQTNENGDLMTNFCLLNELRINNTFFDHADRYKYTFHNTRGHKSMIDYVLTNRGIHPTQILDVRTLNSANVGTDHSLLLTKIRMKIKPKKEITENITEEKFIIESLWNESTKQLYQSRIRKHIETNPTTNEETVEESWKKLSTNIEKAANEAIGKRKTTKKVSTKIPWFCKEVKQKCQEKKRAYLKYKSINTSEAYEEYKRIRNETKLLVIKLKSEYWERFSKNMESDFYGLQKQMWRLIRSQRKEITELVESNKIDEKTWVKYLTELFKADINTDDENAPTIMVEDETSVSYLEVEKAIRQLKNRKSPGLDQIPNELLKYGGDRLTKEITSLIRKIILIHRIPDSWRTSIMILLFKKGDKMKPENYRGINLLNTMLKLTTKVITNLINSRITLSEEQQGFRTGRSCTDAVFIIRQIVEKSVEYNRPAYMCFIDLQKAFDRIQVQDVIHLLYNRGIPLSIIKTIENIYKNKIQAKVNGKLTTQITVNNGIRQGDSLSPLLFNIVMDELIKEVKKGKGYKLRDSEITVLCYADDAVLVAEREDELQRLLNIFNITGKKFNMIISSEKTKCMTTSAEPIRCKLEVDGKVIQQEMKFMYLGIELSANASIDKEVKRQITKANKVAGSLNDTIWRNKHLQQQTKARIYKATVRPIMTYMAETRPTTTNTCRLLETAEMKTLRKIAGKTLMDRERSENIRSACNVDNINKWIHGRKQDWNDHISRMTDNRIVKIVRDKSPVGKRSVGRPRKRWCDSLNVEQ